MNIFQDFISEQSFSSHIIDNLGIYDVNIYSRQMEEDIDVLEYILMHIYCGKDYLKKKGIFISEKLNALRPIIKTKNQMNKATFFDLICSALSEIRDSHLVFSLPYFQKTHCFCIHNTAYFSDIVLKEDYDKYIVVSSNDSSAQSGDSITDVDERLFQTSEGLLLYGVLSEKPIRSIKCICEGKQINLNVSPIPEKQILGKEIWSYQKHNDIDIITLSRLTTFNATEEHEMESLIAFGKELRASQKIILDLRGNRGGNSEYAIRFIKNLNGNAQLNLNYAKLISQGSRLAELSLYAEHLDNYNKVRKEILSDPVSNWRFSDQCSISEPKYKNKLVVLTDRNTASSAEIMLKCIKDNIPQSVIIGENTSGTLNTGDVRYFYLPNSMIFLNIPTALFAGIFEEGTGFYPDIWSKDDALQSAIDYLSQNSC